MVGVLISITKSSINVGVARSSRLVKWKPDEVWDKIHDKSLDKVHDKIVHQVTITREADTGNSCDISHESQYPFIKYFGAYMYKFHRLQPLIIR